MGKRHVWTSRSRNTARITTEIDRIVDKRKIVKLHVALHIAPVSPPTASCIPGAPVKTVGWEMDRLRMYTGRQSCQGYPKRTLLEFLRDLCILV